MNWPGFFINAFITKRGPLSIVHFLTDRCNARCPHCFIDFNNPAPVGALLTFDEIRRLTKTMGRGLYNVNLTGGEPFLREDLFEIVSAYFENTTAKSIVITSNGSLVNAIKSFVDKFAHSGIKGRVKLSFSLDDFEDKHDALRNIKGAFSSSLEAYRVVEGCRDSRLMADIALTVTPYNYRDILDLHTALKEKGIQHFSAILMRAEGIVKSINNKSDVMNAYRKLVTRILADQQLQKIPSQHRLIEAIRRYKNALVLDLFSGTSLSPSRVSACEAGRLFGIIYPNGDVYPCEILDRAWCFGNVRDTDLNFIGLWRGGKASSLRNLLHQARCSCTYECAWSVNVVANPVYWARMFMLSCRNMLWNRKA